ncbi:MAG: hypothetical protein U9R79_20340 [Armatimonadota bacterium]|nr:hypothetical protein [Armatimonadota bacterium]
MLAQLAQALERLFSGGEGKQPLLCSSRSFTLAVRCHQCAETIRLRIDRDHELQSVYAEDAEEGDDPQEYVLRKEIVGEDCQNLIRFTIRFDRDRGVVASEIEGGEFIDEEPGRTRALAPQGSESGS